MDNNVRKPQPRSDSAYDLGVSDEYETNLAPHENLKKFLSLSVSSIQEFTNKLQCSSERIGEDKSIYSRNIKFKVLRFGFLIANFINTLLLRKHSNITIHKKSDITFVPENSAKNYETVKIDATDQLLINDLKPGDPKFFFQDEKRPIFNTNAEISPFNIRQNDNRSSCYLLSMMISYTSTDNIRNLISKEMVTELENNKVKVSFINEQHQIKFDVIVEKDKLITNDHSFVYSNNESSDTAWASLVEKAYHGLRIVLKNSVISDSFLENTDLSQDAIDKIKNDITQDMTGSTSKSNNSLDFANSKFSASFLPKIPTSEPIAGLQQVKDIQQYSLKTNKNQTKYHEQTLKILFENAKLGIPMNVNSKSKTNIFNKIRTGFQAIPSSHAMAVIGAATKEKSNGKKIEGLILFDPYANPLPNEKLMTAIKNGTDLPIDIRNSESCIKFIPLKDMDKYFEECVIAPGGFKLN